LAGALEVFDFGDELLELTVLEADELETEQGTI